jgi:GAF domain-containing protein
MAFATTDLRSLTTIAGIAADAIQRATLQAQANLRLENLEALHATDLIIGSSYDLHFTLDLLLSQGYAGQAALERRTISVANLAEVEPDSARAPLLTGEGFQVYCGVPLIAKGVVEGVLEVFHRAHLICASTKWKGTRSALPRSWSIWRGRWGSVRTTSSTSGAVRYCMTLARWAYLTASC